MCRKAPVNHMNPFRNVLIVRGSNEYGCFRAILKCHNAIQRSAPLCHRCNCIGQRHGAERASCRLSNLPPGGFVNAAETYGRSKLPQWRYKTGQSMEMNCRHWLSCLYTASGNAAEAPSTVVVHPFLKKIVGHYTC